MISWFKARPLKEQRTILAGTILSSTMLFYLFVWSPISSKTHFYQQQLRYQQTLHFWMANAKRQYKNQSENPLTPVALLPEKITESLKNSAIKAYSAALSQNNESQLQLDFTQVPYQGFIEWLTTLHRQYKVQIEEATINAKEHNGMVAVMITFKE